MDKLARTPYRNGRRDQNRSLPADWSLQFRRILSGGSRPSCQSADESDSPARSDRVPVYQAIELYLKAFLRLHDISMSRLRRISHDFIQLGVQAQAKGLVLNSKDLEILQVIGEGDAWARARYLEVGMLKTPDIGELARACERLHEAIGQAMMSAGLPVRIPAARRFDIGGRVPSQTGANE
jgi:hypothetical protein